MNIRPSRVLLLLGVLSALCPHARAQEPIDNETWKARCLQLSASSADIDRGSASPQLLQTTRGIPGAKFEAVAHERAAAGQHYIACTLYFTAAMAERMGNGGKINTSKAHSDVGVAEVELKRATGQPLSFAEKMSGTSGKLTSSVKPGSLSPADVAAVFGAFADSPAPESPGPPPARNSSGPPHRPPPSQN